jgi:CheY-like chemotaxis protein
MATILIIDDEEIVQVLLRSALKAAGYEELRLPTVARGLSCIATGRRT